MATTATRPRSTATTCPAWPPSRRAQADIEIAYEELADGARLTFTSEDPELIEALHRWGEAQVTDHGEHAEAG